MTLPVWTFPPDWNKEVRVSYSFLTEIIESREGREQRISVRNKARISYDFAVLLEGYDFRTLAARLNTQQWAEMMMPDWTRPIFLNRDHSPGESALRVYESDSWATSGTDAVLIWDETGETQSQLVTVQSRSSTTVTIVDPITRTIPKGAALHRLSQGHLEPSIKGTMQTDRLIAANISFKIDPGFEYWPSVPEATETHDGRELFLVEPNWSTPPSIEFMASSETVDYGKGRIGYFSPIPFSSRLTGADFLAIGRTETNNLVDFFRRQRGQCGEFFMPTFTEDLRLRENAPNNTNQLRIVGPEAALHFSDSLVHKNIVIFYEDGTKEAHKVTRIEAFSDGVGADSIVYITPNTRRTVRVADVDMICWLPLCRLASDELVVQCVTDEIANVGMTIKTLEYLPVET